MVGCEIRFSPELDELFGVTNNKQSVREVDYIDFENFKNEHPDEWEQELEENDKLKLRIELSRAFKGFYNNAYKLITERQRGSRGGNSEDKAKPDRSTKIANDVLSGARAPTKSSAEGQAKSEDQRQAEWIKRLLEGDPNLTEAEATATAPLKTPLKIEKDFRSWPGSTFFTMEITGSTAVLVINQQHPFYAEVYERLLEADDPNAVEALDLLMYGYIRMQDERYSQAELLDGVSEDWGRHVKSFLVELRNRD